MAFSESRLQLRAVDSAAARLHRCTKYASVALSLQVQDVRMIWSPEVFRTHSVLIDRLLMDRLITCQGGRLNAWTSNFFRGAANTSSQSPLRSTQTFTPVQFFYSPDLLAFWDQWKAIPILVPPGNFLRLSVQSSSYGLATTSTTIFFPAAEGLVHHAL